MEVEKPKPLVPALMLLAIAAANEQGEYSLGFKLQELYDAYVAVPK